MLAELKYFTALPPLLLGKTSTIPPFWVWKLVNEEGAAEEEAEEEVGGVQGLDLGLGGMGRWIRIRGRSRRYWW